MLHITLHITAQSLHMSLEEHVKNAGNISKRVIT